MTKDEALKMAIEALETAEVQSEYDGLSDMIFKAIIACKEALGQPTKEWQGFESPHEHKVPAEALEQPKEKKYLYVYNTEGLMTLGYKPHPAINMHNTFIIGKIEVQDD